MITKNKKLALKYHDYCLVCGKKNEHSWQLKFITNDNGITSTQFQSNSDFQGYNGCLHGGIITTLLDATMTHCLFDHGIVAMTGNLRVRFLQPIPCNSLLYIEARIMKSNKNLYVLRAEIIFNQAIMAWAEASFMQVRPKT